MFLQNWRRLKFSGSVALPNYSYYKPSETQRNRLNSQKAFAERKRSELVSRGVPLFRARALHPLGTWIRTISVPDPFMTCVHVVKHFRRKVFHAKLLNRKRGLPLDHKSLDSLRVFLLGEAAQVNPSVTWGGFSPFSIPHGIPGKVQGVNREWLGFIHSDFFPENLDKKDFIPTDYGTVSASWVFTFEHFKKFLTNKRGTIGVSRLIKLFRFYGLELGLPYVGGITPNCFKYVKQKVGAFPGIMTSNLEEKKKGELTTEYTDMAILLFEKLRIGKLFDTSPWTFGARVRKQRDLWSSDAPPECRGILMNEFATSIFSQGFVQSISDYLIANKTSAMMIGASIFNGGYIRLRQPDDEAYHTLEGDWEYFDSHVMKEHIEASFSIFRLCFHKSDHYDNCFYFMMSSLLNKNIIIPGGLTFQLNDGMPSGTPWTNLMNSLINWLILRDVLDMMYGKDSIRVKIQCGGDDFKLFFPEDIVLDIERFQHFASSRHGMVLPNSKIKIGRGGATCEEEATSFYKTIFINGNPTIAMRDLEKRLALPEHGKHSLLHTFQHAEATFDSGIGHGDTKELLCCYLTYLILRLDMVGREDFNANFKRLISKIRELHDQNRQKNIYNFKFHTERDLFPSLFAKDRKICYDFNCKTNFTQDELLLKLNKTVLLRQ
jgi:hypothetical protein